MRRSLGVSEGRLGNWFFATIGQMVWLGSKVRNTLLVA